MIKWHWERDKEILDDKVKESESILKCLFNLLDNNKASKNCLKSEFCKFTCDMHSKMGF